MDGEIRWIIRYSDVAATYLELLMGFQQASTMFELYQMVKSTTTLISFNHKEETMRATATTAATDAN